MFEISSKTGIHHLVGGAVPDNSAALRMLRGTELPEAQEPRNPDNSNPPQSAHGWASP